MIQIGTLKVINTSTYRASVQIRGSLATFLTNIPVADNIQISQLVVGRRVAVLRFDETNPADGVVVGVWAEDTAPTYEVFDIKVGPFYEGGVVLTTGSKARLDMWTDFAMVITQATLTGAPLGSIVLDIWVDTYANHPPTVADTITASAKPTLSAATKSQDATLTGWTTSIPANRMWRFNIDSAATVTSAVLTLKCRRDT